MKYNKLGYQTADPFYYNRLKEFAKHNRNNPTDAERVMWQGLKSENLGYRFRRQHIIGCFIADFACIEKGVVIEIDGGYHQLPEQQVCDEEREQWLNANGYNVLRFTNNEVLGNIDDVIERITNFIDY